MPGMLLLENASNYAMQLTASTSAIFAVRVCPLPFPPRRDRIGLAALLIRSSP